MEPKDEKQQILPKLDGEKESLITEGAGAQVILETGRVGDKHTHYEATAWYKGQSVIVEIPGFVAEEFQKNHGKSVRDVRGIRFTVNASDIRRNDQLVEECQNPYYTPGQKRINLRYADSLEPVE